MKKTRPSASLLQMSAGTALHDIRAVMKGMSKKDFELDKSYAVLNDGGGCEAVAASAAYWPQQGQPLTAGLVVAPYLLGKD
eukprot:9890826-Heterocapsa_arctica.AAC.1